MTPDQERARGARAQRILDDDVYQESWRAVEAVLVDQMARIETTAERGFHLQCVLKGLRKAREQLEQVMQNGKVAEEQIQRERTLADKILRRA